MQQLISVALSSLLAAGLYATMAYGLAVIYGVMRIINLAHAGFMMLGAYITFALFSRFSLDPFIGIVVVGPLFFFFGVVLYRAVGKSMARSGATPSIEPLLPLFGVWLVLQNLAYVIWTRDNPSILTWYTMKSIKVFGVHLGVPSVFVFLASAASLVFLNVLLKRTYLGKAIRAVTQNRDAARLSGVDAARISATALAL